MAAEDAARKAMEHVCGRRVEVAGRGRPRAALSARRAVSRDFERDVTPTRTTVAAAQAPASLELTADGVAPVRGVPAHDAESAVTAPARRTGDDVIQKNGRN